MCYFLLLHKTEQLCDSTSESSRAVKNTLRQQPPTRAVQKKP